MSYYANGAGDILLKKEAPVDELIADLEDVFSEVCRADWMKPREDGIWIEVIQNDRFHCDDAEEALTKIDPFTLEGEICMRGEDDSIWRYRFADGAWRKEQAYVLYEEDRKDGCCVPVFVVTNGGKPVAAFADRKRAEDFCREEEKAGRGTREIAETALTI